MKIQVTDNWQIVFDSSSQITVQNKRVIEDSKSLKDKSKIGTFTWKDVSHHSKLILAYESILNKGGESCNSLDELFYLYDHILIQVMKINQKQLFEKL